MEKFDLKQYEKIKELMGDLEEDELMGRVDNLLEQNTTTDEANSFISACQEGMDIIGERFQSGEYFVGDLIYAGELLMDILSKFKPVIGSEETEAVGTILLGTVKGDLHDIGKNIFRSMSEAAGFKIVDIGVDQSIDSFTEKIKEVKPDIVGLSGVLTLAIESMKDTINGFKEAGLRDDIKIIVGGAPVSRTVCEYVGADAFTTNAAEGVNICKKFMGV
jgi:methanogenic corrinoid protein MtbC1